MANSFAGRWDLTLTGPNGSWPQWMEMADNGDLRVQPRSGSVHPVKDAKVEGSHMTVGMGGGTEWQLDVSGDRLTGTQ